MLRELRVKNFAIIDELSMSFGEGLNILTGETGAGKSIVVGALGVALGGRAYTEMIKTGCAEATVEARFDITGHPVLEKMGIASDDGIVIRRNISSAGKGRAYINGSIANIQSLAELGRSLVDVHGQHEHQSLLSSDSQMRLLDRFGGLEAEREEVAALYEKVRSIKGRLDTIRAGARETARKLDLLKFQAEEIEAASLSPGEDERLEEERKILSNLSRLNELCETSYALLYSDEGSSMEKASGAAAGLREMASIDHGASGILEVLEQALPLLEDASLSIRDLREKYHLEPGRLQMVDDRLELIRNLKRKYGDTVEAVLAFMEDAVKELGELERAGETTEELEKELDEKEARLGRASSELSEKRKKAARRTEAAIGKVLKGLALEKSEFRIDINDAPVNSTGIDAVEFLFTANRGEALKPLQRVASGGELSRVMLAIKSVLREADRIPVLVFDEVDAGIGGKTASNVAMKLKEISANHQVLCITHLPQIASKAESHFLVEKVEKSGRACVIVKELTGRVRQEEIARMLSGNVTEKSLEHAREIMEGDA